MDRDLAVVIGQAARQARAALGLTQEQVAEKLGVSVEFYARASSAAVRTRASRPFGA